MDILYNELKTLLTILRKQEYVFLFRYLCWWVLWFFYKKPLWIFATNLWWYTFKVPLYQPIHWMLSEIFIYETLHHLQWGKRVLELWWFIWESALYLATHNKHVDVYELDPEHFAYLEKNCLQKKNITMFPRWVGDSEKTVSIEKSWLFDPAGHANNTWTHWSQGHIKAIDTLPLDTYDTIKIDIEGAEFTILPYLIDNEFFSWKKWFIEFHFTSWNETIIQKNIFRQTVALLRKKWHTLWCIDNYNTHILESLREESLFLSLCFTK